MPGKILIIDDVPANRVVLKVKLAAACYDAVAEHSGQDIVALVRGIRPRLVIVDADHPDAPALQAIEALRADAEFGTLPVIVTGAPSDRASHTELMLAALARGADAFHPKPVEDALLLARIRQLLRLREISEELRLRETTSHALGFAEEIEPFARPARIALIAGDVETGQRWQEVLKGHFAHRISVLDQHAALGEHAPALQDVYVIASELKRPGDGLHLMSELRSRRWSRHAPCLIVMPGSDPAQAAMALDLGAADLIDEPVEGSELALRLTALIARKRESDQLRRRVRDGLKLAVTDPLTGLYNRRYALSHLARIRNNAAHSGKSFAVMALDLDHFKQVNDRYGHAAGDEVLRSVAKRIAGNLRSVDMVARIGGEEFLVAMPDTTEEDARRAAQRLCRLIEAEPIPLPAPARGSLRQTVSIGVALGGGAGSDWVDEAGAEAMLEALIDQADRALLSSKAHGRNTVTLGRNAA
ncbi:diguanylate cyclase [Vannielia litorea]|uniref:diguanylate cyclase n=1 Tax=Vannielia litorea TaxID=1217970 RepID=UPI001C97FB28|nr:diguanylate cyclase [Vannielia litorea]MBY6047793.1 diguanylate cyclase [Vannielia litorea]MBY6075207.1 diguanylate cyclase [Vannielia litorea]